MRDGWKVDNQSRDIQVQTEQNRRFRMLERGQQENALESAPNRLSFVLCTSFLPAQKRPSQRCRQRQCQWQRRCPELPLHRRTIKAQGNDEQEKELNLAKYLLNGDVRAGMQYMLNQHLEQVKQFTKRGIENAISKSQPEKDEQLQTPTEDNEDQVNEPEDSPALTTFDPVTALILAGYAFRAYLDPTDSCHQEQFKSYVSEPSTTASKQTPVRKTITTQFHYAHAPMISSVATGVFLLTFDVSSLNENQNTIFYTASVDASIVTNVCKNGSGNASLVRIPKRDDTYHNALDDSIKRPDILHVYLHASESDFKNGIPASHVASLSLADLIVRASDTEEMSQLEEAVLQFERLPEENVEKDMFQSSLVLNEFGFPFANLLSSKTVPITDGVLSDMRIVVKAAYVPFTWQEGSNTQELQVERENAPEQSKHAATVEDFHKAAKSLDELMLKTESNQLFNEYFGPSYRLPNQSDWMRLSRACRTIVSTIEKHLPIERTIEIHEDAPAYLFIQCIQTDTEIWLFRDDIHNNVIVSFRGTEQVSMRDFFTDAQVFMQRWKPGDSIDLQISSDRTIGMEDMLPDLIRNFTNSGAKARDDDGDGAGISAVHYGFLQAYLSIQSALLRGIDLVSSGLPDDYKLLFTGHSLGGALATLASVDFQARFAWPDERICCMTYGAPKVGNVHFASRYDQLVQNCYRIVNDTDIITRLPQSSYSSPPASSSVSSNTKSSMRESMQELLNRYQHSGRTVLINDDGDFWVEGIHDMTTNGNWGSGENCLQDLLAFENNSLKELVSGRSVKRHMVSNSNNSCVLSSHHVSKIFDQSVILTNKLSVTELWATG